MVATCSFPDWTETVGDYFLIHSDNIPGTNAEIVFKDNKYVQTHIPIEPSQPKTQEITDADSRINFLEKAVMDLAQYVSNLEEKITQMEKEKNND